MTPEDKQKARELALAFESFSFHVEKGKTIEGTRLGVLNDAARRLRAAQQDCGIFLIQDVRAHVKALFGVDIGA